MDYATIVENYVNDAWREGKTTLEIKAELVAKRWPAEMVDAIIDRMVKQKVEANEGKKPDAGGPDLWSEPTWPVENDNWTAPDAATQTTRSVDKIYSNSLNSIVKSEKNKKKRFSAKIASNSSDTVKPDVVSPEKVSASTDQTPSPADAVNPPATQEPAPSTTKTENDSLPSVTSSETTPTASPTQFPTTPQPINQANFTPETTPTPDITNVQSTTPAITQESPVASETAAAPMPVSHATTPSKLVEFIKANRAQEKKLPQKLQENHNARLQDEKIQFRSLIFLGILFFVIILALLWKIFVLQ